MALNLASLITNTVRCYPDETALIDGGSTLTYREFARLVEAFAAHLRAQGVQPGDKVALLFPNTMSFTIAYYGILHAGGVVVPISFLSVAREIRYSLEDSEAAVLVAYEEYAPQASEAFAAVTLCHSLVLAGESNGPLTLLEGTLDRNAACDLADRNPDDTAVILYTSGTTGQPKGAELTHFNMWSNADLSAWRLLSTPEHVERLGPGHVVLAALPLFHSFGQTCNQNATVMAGGTLTYIKRFEPVPALETMARDRVTLFSGVPTMYLALLNTPAREQYDLSSLQYCFSGGAAMPIEVFKRFSESFGVPILEGYGLSETSPVATFNVLHQECRVGSIGIPVYGCEVKIVDDQNQELPADAIGEVVIRGHNVMKGYYRRPEATAEAFRGGWFHSGDMGRQDGDGYLYIVDRKKDMIIRGGFNVYPREVEEILYAHPAVREAAVVGVPNANYGEEIKAYVSLRAEPEHASVTQDELQKFCKEQIAATKYPRLFEILPDLPKGSTGKILRKELREKAREGDA
jgi:long-chain acyl-CoA synthetase